MRIGDEFEISIANSQLKDLLDANKSGIPSIMGATTAIIGGLIVADVNNSAYADYMNLVHDVLKKNLSEDEYQEFYDAGRKFCEHASKIQELDGEVSLDF